MNSLVASTKATGELCGWRLYSSGSGAESELAREGKMPFDFGSFWFKGQAIRTGRANVKAYNRQLSRLIHHDKASPGKIISHRLSLEEAPAGYKHFDERDEGWTKVILKP